ncbi:unnamed protein product [Urochloa humidicola]
MGLDERGSPRRPGSWTTPARAAAPLVGVGSVPPCRRRGQSTPKQAAPPPKADHAEAGRAAAGGRPRGSRPRATEPATAGSCPRCRRGPSAPPCPRAAGGHPPEQRRARLARPRAARRAAAGGLMCWSRPHNSVKLAALPVRGRQLGLVRRLEVGRMERVVCGGESYPLGRLERLRDGEAV